MTRGRTLVGVAVAAGLVAVPVPAQAALRWHRCTGGDECATLTVPLDRTGAVPGTVPLHVVRDNRDSRRREGLTLLLGGEPGEAATPRFFGEYASEIVETVAEATPDNQVVGFDQRGTGKSGVLRCRDLQAAAPTDAGREAAACATLLGDRRGLYRTTETVADIESLRAELAVERMTIVASGYGTYVAQRYLLAHPDRVERLVLTSPVDAAGLDPLMRDTLAAAGRSLRATCRRGCGFTDDPAADVEQLIQRGPIRGYVIGGDGRHRRATLTPQELLFTVAAGDRDLFTQADLPAAVKAMLRGDSALLFRLERRAVASGRNRPVRERSEATRAAVLCEEVRYPWAWHASPAERSAATEAAAGLLTAELARPFGVDAAIRSDLMKLCRHWPTASGEPPPDPGPMPDAPVLVIASNRFVRAPIETARRVAGRFARAHVTLTPSFFGDVFLSETNCLERALKRFVAGGAVPSRCPGSERRLAAGRLPPRSLARLRPVRGVDRRRGRVLRAVELTINDLTEDIYATVFARGTGFTEPLRGTGLRGGRYALGESRSVGSRLEFVPGVRIGWSGSSDDDDIVLRVDAPGRLDGGLRVGEADGDDQLAVFVKGRLGGRPVRAKLRYTSRLFGAVGAGE